MDNSVWRASNTWPRDLAGYTFLARVFDKIGQSKFGSAWTGFEGKAATGVHTQDLSRLPLEQGLPVFRERAGVSAEEHEKARQRGQAVVDEIITQAEAGEIRARARAISGDMIVVPTKMWN